MPEDKLPAVAFTYNGTDVVKDADGLINLNLMHQAAGAPENKEPWRWAQTEKGGGFIADLAKDLNHAKNVVWKSRRGKHLGGTFAHWQIALAYAAYLSNEFHRHVNAVYIEYQRESRDPGLKMERAVAGFERQGKAISWIYRRFKGILARNQLTATMAEHNCKLVGHDNPFAEITRGMSLKIIGKTPAEFKQDKGLPASATTRDHFDEDQLISFEWAEIQARKLIQSEAAVGNAECVDAGIRAASAVKLALESLKKKN
jgi:hypothetical protein